MIYTHTKEANRKDEKNKSRCYLPARHGEPRLMCRHACTSVNATSHLAGFSFDNKTSRDKLFAAKRFFCLGIRLGTCTGLNQSIDTLSKQAVLK